MTDGVPVQRLLRERVAEEVRALLARKMMTGADLAAAIGRSPMYVSRRVRGEVAFDLDDMQRIAGALGVGLHDLLPSPAEAAAAPMPRSTHGCATVPAGRGIHTGRTPDNRPAGRPSAGTAPGISRTGYVDRASRRKRDR